MSERGRCFDLTGNNCKQKESTCLVVRILTIVIWYLRRRASSATQRRDFDLIPFGPSRSGDKPDLLAHWAKRHVSPATLSLLVLTRLVVVRRSLGVITALRRRQVTRYIQWSCHDYQRPLMVSDVEKCRPP